MILKVHFTGALFLKVNRADPDSRAHHFHTTLPHTGYPENQHDREQQRLLKLISSHRALIPVWEQLAMDQFNPGQAVPRQVFTPSILRPVDFNSVCCCQLHWLSLGNRCVSATGSLL